MKTINLTQGKVALVDGWVKRDNAMTQEDYITLKEYIDLKIAAAEAVNLLRYNDSQAAITKAEAAMTIRLESLNEFRASLKDQTSSYITRTEHEAVNSRYDEKLSDLTKSRDIAAGKASQISVNIAYILAGIGILLSITGIAIELFKAAK